MSEKNEKADRKAVKEAGMPTNGELFIAMPAIGKLVDMDFHVSDSIKLRKLKNQLLEPYKVITEVRDALIKKYGQEEPKGSGQITVIGPNDPNGRPMSPDFMKFVEENATLMLPVCDAKFEKIKLPSQIDGKPISLSSNDLDRIDKFIEII